MKHVYTWCLLLLAACVIIPSFPATAQECNITISASGTVLCENEQVKLIGNASFEVTEWTWFREGTPDAVGQTQHLDISSPGTYTLVATGAICQAVASEPVVVSSGYRLQFDGLMQGASEVCAGSTVSYTVPPVLHANSYSWQVPHDWVIESGQGSNTMEVTAGWAEGYVVVQARNECGTVSQERYVKAGEGIVNNIIESSWSWCAGLVYGPLRGEIPVSCTNESFTFQWESSTDQVQFSPIAGATGQDYLPEKMYTTTWFRRKVITGTTTHTSNVAEITIMPVPEPPLIDDVTIFFGEEATLQVQSPLLRTTYYWYDEAGNPIGKGASFTAGALKTNSTFYVSVATNCESDRSRVQVTVRSKAAAPVASNDTICAGSSAVLSIDQPNPAFSYNWYTFAEGGAPVAMGKNFFTPALTQTALYFVAADTGEGETARTPVSAVVLPVLTNNTITGNQTVCAGHPPLELNGSVPAGGDGHYTYSWQMSTDGVSFEQAAADNSKPDYTPDNIFQKTWYRRVVKSAPSGCESISNVVAVNIMAPITNNELLPPPPVCAGTWIKEITGTYPTGGDGSYRFQWQIETNGHFIPLADGTNKDYHPHQLEKTTRFRRMVFSGTCVSVSQPVDVVVNQAPDKPVIYRNNLELRASINSFTYEWRHNGELLEYATQTITIQASGFYQMRVINANGCYAYSDSLEVLLQPTSLPAKQAKEIITLVPNPAACGVVKLLLPETWYQTDILITDAAGKAVYRMYFEMLPKEQVLQLNTLPAGTYLVLLQSASRQARQKLVVTR